MSYFSLWEGSRDISFHLYSAYPEVEANGGLNSFTWVIATVLEAVTIISRLLKLSGGLIPVLCEFSCAACTL